MSDQSRDPGPAMASSTAAQLYDSLPIPRDSQFIRVLDIPAKNSATSEGLTGSLRIVDLKDSPKFTALSYVWGKGSGKSINCNGYDVAVTDSCFDALCSLGNVLGSLTIWVDAVCINQMDNDEKSAQIPFMEDIYTWAEAVYIWLGPRTLNTVQAVDYIRSASQYRFFPTGIPWRTGNKPMTNFQEQIWIYMNTFSTVFLRNAVDLLLLRQLVPTCPSCGLVPFLELMDQAWLARSWTFQEIALASNPILAFGRDHIPWLEWCQALDWIHDLGPTPKVSLGYTPDGDIMDCDDCVDDMTAPWRSLEKWMSLCNVWQVLPRPCFWNGERFRKVLDESGCPKHDCSVREYLQALGACRIQAHAILSATCLRALTGCLVFLLGLTLGRCALRWNFEKRPSIWTASVIVTALCISLYLLIISTSLLILLFSQPSWGKSCCIVRLRGSDSRDHLVELIRAMRERKCSLKGDKVFAIRAILQRLSINLPMPDCRKSTGEIYQDFFASLVQWDPSFIGLLIDTGCPLPGTPSWVPNWGTTTERSWLPSSPIYDFIRDPGWSYKWLEKRRLAISIRENTLLVQAALLGTAVHCTSPFRMVELDCMGNVRPEMKESLLRNIQALCQWVTRVRRDYLVDSEYDSVPLAILSTLKGCKYGDHTTIYTDPRRIFNKVFEIMRRRNAQLEKESEGMTGILPATRATLDDLAAEKPCLNFVIKVCNELSGRRGLFLCSTGLLGSGPETMLEGDSVALVKGVTAPIIVRRQSGGAQGGMYTVLGPGFVDSLMALLPYSPRVKKLDWKQIDLI